jgi:diacylglycerol kinase family enzyme
MPSARVRARSTAWLALLGAVGVVVSLVALVVRNAVGIVVALVALALAGAAAWVAGTRRGMMRVLAVAVVVLAVVGAVWALVAADAIDELVLLAVSVAAFAIGARSAFGDEVGQPATAPPRGVNGRGTSKVLVINPRSGGGRAELFGLAAEARRRGIEHIVLEPGDSLEELARDAAARAEVIGMAGGDGSQALVAGVAAAAGAAFVCIPAGTRNHLALDLGIDRDDVVGALDAFDSDLEQVVDLAEVSGRTFVNNVSLGVYAEIVQSGEYRDAKLGTAARMLPDLLGDDAAAAIAFRGPDGDLHEHARIVLVSNNPYVLDRVAGRGGRPRLDTGRLGALAVEVENAADAAALLSLDSVGQVRRFHGWLEWTADELDVYAGQPVPAGIDGEAVVLDPPLRFTIHPAALRVRLTQDAARERARRALLHEGAADVFSNLWSVATR